MKKKQTTALTVVERAAIAVRSTPELKQELAELAEGSKHITTITNPDGRQQVHAALMVLKNRRIDIEKIGKAAREDATAFRNAVIAEEDALVALIQPEEERLQAIRDAWDDRIEAERQAQVKAEQERQAAIQQRIEAIRNTVQAAALCKTAGEIAQLLDVVDRALITAELFEEQLEVAADAKAQAFERLSKMHEVAVAREAEADRLKAERAELDRRAAEQAERERQQREREETERKRKADIEMRLNWLRGNQALTAMSSPALINQNLVEIRDASITDMFYGEFLQQARDIQIATIARLEGLYTAAMDYQQEKARQAAEAERIRKQGEELAAAQRAEQERKDREEQARRDEEARQNRAREEQQAREAAERERQERHDFVPTLDAVVLVLSTTYGQTTERVMEWLPSLVEDARPKKAA